MLSVRISNGFFAILLFPPLYRLTISTVDIITSNLDIVKRLFRDWKTASQKDGPPRPLVTLSGNKKGQLRLPPLLPYLTAAHAGTFPSAALFRCIFNYDLIFMRSSAMQK